MTRRLRELIIASGNAGTSGQSFLNHVTGAASGARMTDYLVSDWAFSGDIPAPEIAYNSGEVFATTLSMTQGSRAFHIKRTGTAALDLVITSQPAGSNVTLSQNILADATGHTCTFTVTSAYDPNATPTYGAWFDGYSFPNYPANTDPEDILFDFQISGASGSGEHTITWDVEYQPDTGPFNNMLNESFSARMNDRAETEADWEVEWHNNSSYTSLYTTARDFIWTQSSYQEDKTFYLRARRIGEGSWTNVGAVVFQDPRPDV